MYPMSGLAAEKQKECYLEVSTLLNSVLFNVVAISVDRASTSRTFFIDYLFGGIIRSHIVDSVTLCRALDTGHA